MASGVAQVRAYCQHRSQPQRPDERDDAEGAVWLQVRATAHTDGKSQQASYSLTLVLVRKTLRYKTESTLLKRKIFVGGIGPLGPAQLHGSAQLAQCVTPR
eukprot:SAG31_NODE_32625_length_353_cov_1.003937_1_plen_100_part_01